MPATPLVTVVLTSYNHGRFIEEALQSVLDQSMDDIEVLCVDDASTDDSAQRLARFDDPRVRVIPNRVNRGLHHRNLALRHARGAYVAFQNSDDIWHREKLAKQIDFLGANPACGACFTAVQLCDEESQPCPNDPVYGRLFALVEHDRWQWLNRFYHSGNCLALPSALVRAATLGRTELMDPCLFQCGDWDLWVQIAGLAELHVLSEPLTTIRVCSNGRNLSAPTPAALNRTNREAIEILLRYARQPILGQIDRIFREDLEPIIPADGLSECSALARLGMMATSSQQRRHRLAGIEFLRLSLRRADIEGGLSQETRSRAAHRLFMVSGELGAQVEEGKPVEPDSVELTAQLFWRFKSTDFSEQQSTQVTYAVSATPVRLLIPLPPPGRRLTALRFDLANRPVRLLVHELTLCSSRGDALWRCPSDPGYFETIAMNCYRPAFGSGIVIQALNNDPQWILPLPSWIFGALSSGGTLDLTVQLA